jgi:hypothetical protein
VTCLESFPGYDRLLLFVYRTENLHQANWYGPLLHRSRVLVAAIGIILAFGLDSSTLDTSLHFGNEGLHVFLVFADKCHCIPALACGERVCQLRLDRSGGRGKPHTPSWVAAHFDTLGLGLRGQSSEVAGHLALSQRSTEQYSMDALALGIHEPR